MTTIPEYTNVTTTPEYVNRTTIPQYVNVTTSAEYVSVTATTTYVNMTTIPEYVNLTTSPEHVNMTATPEYMNITTPEFIGPFYIYNESFTDYYFICRLTFSDSDTDTQYDVALIFDGELDGSLPVKTTTALAPDVIFTPNDFGQHFGQWVTDQVI